MPRAHLFSLLPWYQFHPHSLLSSASDSHAVCIFSDFIPLSFSFASIRIVSWWWIVMTWETCDCITILKRCRKKIRGRISLRIDRKAAAMLWCTQICVCDGKERRISNDGKSSAEGEAREKYLRKSYKTFLSFLFFDCCVRAACLRLWEHLKNRKEDLNDEAERNFSFRFLLLFFPSHPKQTTSIYIDSNRLPFARIAALKKSCSMESTADLNPQWRWRPVVSIN